VCLGLTFDYPMAGYTLSRSDNSEPR
jgi:hypothetical protein